MRPPDKAYNALSALGFPVTGARPLVIALSDGSTLESGTAASLCSEERQHCTQTVLDRNSDFMHHAMR